MMDSSTQLDLYLTEISIELLGNRIYDVNGTRQNRLMNLFQALPEEDCDNDKSENSVDILCSLGYEQNFSDNEDSAINMLEDQMDFILSDANNSSSTNKDIIDNLRKIKSDQMQLLKDSSETHVKKLVERKKIVTSLNKIRQAATRECSSAATQRKAVTELYTTERDNLLKSCMNTIRLIKYIINDTRNEQLKGELIAFVHAMRSVRESDPNSIRRKVKKPYKRDKEVDKLSKKPL
ncbi:uncharacterized protein [Chironomus tepperi]|uniref:uncharacterized protein n=1 Tax=Chironomus tepperi TaxID=113505 RepID=UPI00391F8101